MRSYVFHTFISTCSCQRSEFGHCWYIIYGDIDVNYIDIGVHLMNESTRINLRILTNC